MSFAPGGADLRRLPRRPPPALAAAPRLPRRDRPGAARRLRPGPPGRAGARARLRRRHRRRSASPRGCRGSTCTASSSSPPMPSSRGATPPRTACRSSVHEGDLRRPPAALRAARLRPRARQPAVPPAAGDRRAPTPGATARIARRGDRSPTGSTPGCAGSVPGGRLVLIHRTARLGEILAALAGRAGAVEILPIASRAGAAGARGCCVRARKGRARAAYPLLSLNLPRRKFARRRRRDAILPRCSGVLRDMAELLPDARLGGIDADVNNYECPQRRGAEGRE